jgi:glycosyltransferase involved in cell wall biosynthesis
VRLPRISVITPSLNQGMFIEDAILSVARQGYADCEHIVVDGGSTDETLTILRRYPHLRWVSEPDNGQSDAINKGLRMATGDLVAWLNADDYYLNQALTMIGQFAASNSDLDIVYGDCLFVDHSGQLLRRKTGHNFDTHILLYYGCYIPSTATFFRRRLIEEGRYLDTQYQMCMDYEYFVRLAAAGKTYGYLSRPLAAFRWHGSNVSLQREKSRRERLQIQQTWSKLKLPVIGYDILAYTFLAKRLALKLLNGNYWTELEACRHRGENTRWFASGYCA